MHCISGIQYLVCLLAVCAAVGVFLVDAYYVYVHVRP